MSQLSITVDGRAVSVADDQRPTQLFAESKEIVVCKINGELKDLWTDLKDGDVVEGVSISSPEGLSVLRHSTAHVMAQAVQQVFAQTRLGIGPPITDGFYYDFDPERPFNPEDLEKIESAMRKIIKDGQRFRRRVTNEADALKELAHEPYKCELIGIKSGAGEEVSVEVGGAELTIYDNLGRDGQPVWSDLCRGPHLPSTKHIPAFKLMRSAAAYWRGSEKNPMLQRIYGTAWPSPEELAAYLELLAEDSPHLTKAALFEKSGHLQWYSEGMYPPMVMDEELHADGTIKRAGQQYYMKPMNCPFHNLIFATRGRSYRELPFRLFEFGTVYRYEKSGVIHGLTRARGFTQDDAHIYCTKEQMVGELDSLLTFVLNLLRDYGLEDFYLELSTRNPEKSVGEDSDWAEATEALRKAALAQNLELVLDEGGAAFYGPKISVQAKDAIGRTWQMSTIQVDFQLPQRFELEYSATDGTRQRPVMIHRALFGSIERFFGVLTEHYSGAFPPWLAPVQVTAIPVAEAFADYLASVVKEFKAAGIRIDLDASDDRMQKKIRNAQMQKVPYMLIAGEEDQQAGKVSIRYRNGEQKNSIAVADAIAEIRSAIADRKQV
jgi:threonyl-tRNA synthetase